MVEPVKIPDDRIYTIAGRLEIGGSASFEHDAMCVDIDGYAYINPFAKPSQTHWANTKADDGKNYILLERVEGGFKVDLTRCRTAWHAGPKPEPKHGIAWLPVVEVVTPSG